MRSMLHSYAKAGGQGTEDPHTYTAARRRRQQKQAGCSSTVREFYSNTPTRQLVPIPAPRCSGSWLNSSRPATRESSRRALHQRQHCGGTWVARSLSMGAPSLQASVSQHDCNRNSRHDRGFGSRSVCTCLVCAQNPALMANDRKLSDPGR
jgi:hypothetical protein